jgi:hypothetical protein
LHAVQNFFPNPSTTYPQPPPQHHNNQPLRTTHLATMSSRKCMHCDAAETSAHHLKNCGRCRMVAYCNKTCQTADWPAHKLVCNKHDGLHLGYVGNTDGDVVFQDPTGATSHEVFKHYIPLRVPPSAELPHGMTTLLKIELLSPRNSRSSLLRRGRSSRTPPPRA